MVKVRVQAFSISLDGFGTGEGLTDDEPFGHAGERLHEWMFAALDDAPAGDPARQGPGRTVLGRHRRRDHGPAQVPRRERPAARRLGGLLGSRAAPPHTGSRADPPPARHLEMAGGTTFHFVDAPPQEALATAVEAAGGLDVRLGGGTETVRAFLEADLVDELHLVLVPIVLGRGQRLWDGQEGLEERFDIEVLPGGSGVTHLLLTRRRTA